MYVVEGCLFSLLLAVVVVLRFLLFLVVFVAVVVAVVPLSSSDGEGAKAEKESNIDGLLSSKARLPALWTLHRISSKAARQAVQEFLADESADVRAAAIHSVGIWRDAEATKRLIDLLESDHEQHRRLAAMALGRIGDRAAVKPLMEAGSKNGDPFSKHAIIYALYEIGDTEILPENNLLAKQVRLMHEVDQKNTTHEVMPTIQPADAVRSDPTYV